MFGLGIIIASAVNAAQQRMDYLNSIPEEKRAEVFRQLSEARERQEAILRATASRNESSLLGGVGGFILGLICGGRGSH